MEAAPFGRLAFDHPHVTEVTLELMRSDVEIHTAFRVDTDIGAAGCCEFYFSFLSLPSVMARVIFIIGSLSLLLFFCSTFARISVTPSRKGTSFILLHLL